MKSTEKQIANRLNKLDKLVVQWEVDIGQLRFELRGLKKTRLKLFKELCKTRGEKII